MVIQIRLHRYPDAPLAVITVKDTGAGIYPDLLLYLLAPFIQAFIRLDERGGVGLGLPPVKGLIALHQGVVRAYSAGAEFTFWLPLCGPPKRSAAVTPGEQPRIAQRVLVIDDHRDGAAALRDLRSDERTRASRLIAGTGYGSNADREQAFDAGFDHHVAEPVDP